MDFKNTSLAKTNVCKRRCETIRLLASGMLLTNVYICENWLEWKLIKQTDENIIVLVDLFPFVL